METVNLSFRYAEQDYVRALRAHYAGRLRLPLDIAAIVGVAVIGAYEWRSGSHGAGIISFCLSGVLALMLVAAFAVIPSIAFRKQLKFRDEYSLSFSPEGIHFQTTHIRLRPQMGHVHVGTGIWLFYATSAVAGHRCWFSKIQE